MTIPSDFGVIEHGSWNKHQEESVLWGLDVDDIGVLEAPPGSGKSCLAKAWSSKKATIVLTKTKFLQDQYVDGYSATLLKGRGNYDCVHPDSYDHRCDECLFQDEGMRHCPVYSRCEYMCAKWKALGSPWTTLNYAYWLRATSFRELTGRWIVLDEAHTLSNTILDFVGIKMTEKKRKRYGLPALPLITGNGSSVLTKTESSIDRVVDWLTRCGRELRKLSTYYERMAALDDSKRRQMKRVERLLSEVNTTRQALDINPTTWFVRSGPDVVDDGGGLICRPLTARYHAPRYLVDGKERTTVAMSATIGDFDVFCNELGIGHWTNRRVPNRFPPETREVHILDAPPMGQKTTTSGYDKQAEVIVRAIQELPTSWSGIILTTSKKKASDLGVRLRRRLGQRIWVPSFDMGTDAQLRAWTRARKRRSNSIAITWAFWEGFDGVKERFVIVAKTPYPFLGDPYEVARQRHDGKYYLQRTAQKMEQGLGRVRRGPGDYNIGGQFNSYVAIADGNWKRVQKYLSQSLREAIR